jgi:hypothetical protein
MPPSNFTRTDRAWSKRRNCLYFIRTMHNSCISCIAYNTYV